MRLPWKLQFWASKAAAAKASCGCRRVLISTKHHSLFSMLTVFQEYTRILWIYTYVWYINWVSINPIIRPLRLFNLWGRWLAFFWSWLNWHSIMIVYTSPRSHCCDPLYWIIAMAIHKSMMGHLDQVGTPGRIFALLGMGEEVWARITFMWDWEVGTKLCAGEG